MFLLSIGCRYSKREQHKAIFPKAIDNPYTDTINHFFEIREQDRGVLSDSIFINFWIGRNDFNGTFKSDLMLAGLTCRSGDTIFLRTLGGTPPIQLFNFSMKQGMSLPQKLFYQKESYNDTSKYILTREYSLQLDTSWSDRELGRLYKFRFKGMGLVDRSFDLVFYTSNEIGVLGISLSFNNKLRKYEEIISFRGYIPYFDRSKYRRNEETSINDIVR